MTQEIISISTQAEYDAVAKEFSTFISNPPETEEGKTRQKYLADLLEEFHDIANAKPEEKLSPTAHIVFYGIVLFVMWGVILYLIA